MVKNPIYVCRECGYVLPKELSELIENKVQVYCEMCGTPFALAGVDFKETTNRYPRKPAHTYPKYGISQGDKTALKRAIKTLNKFSFLPILIFSGIVLGMTSLVFLNPGNWINDLFNHLLISISGILIVIYDLTYISPKVEKEKYDEIVVDAFCYGILGSIIFGTGVILIIKGILIIIYVSINPESKDHKVYNFGIKLKNSLNNFSAKAGFIVILLALWGIINGDIDLYYLTQGLEFIQSNLTFLDAWLIPIILSAIVFTFFLVPVILLIIDAKKKKKIKEKISFTFGDSIRVFILGAICTAFFGSGIFILLKGILIFFLFAGKPIDINKKVQVEIPEEQYPPRPIISSSEEDQIPRESEQEEKKPLLNIVEKHTEDQVPRVPELKEEKEVLIIKEKQIEPEKEKAEEFIPEIEEHEDKEEKEDVKLKLHDSLLPVKSEKDKKLVKDYFTKIFNLLSKDLRKQIMELKIPKKEKKALLQELAFLTEEEQVKYIEAVSNLYKEIPRKLIERIKKLPNVKAQHYDKIVEQLKYMDIQERLEFIQFLEENA